MIPEVPTIDESGLRGYESNAWYGLLAPGKTPQPAIEQLYRDMAKVLRLAEIRDSFKNQGAEPVGNTPDQFRAIIRSEIEKWRKVVQAIGAKID